MNQRERTVGLITLIVLGALGLYQFVVDPLLGRRSELSTQLASARSDVSDRKDLIDRGKRADSAWKSMVSGGLRKDQSDAESAVLHSVRDWAQEAGMNLSGLTPARPEKEKDFFKITVRASGNGRMSEIARFLHKIQTATIPVRITELQINNRGREGADDLGVQLAISTIYLAPEKSAGPVAEVTR